MASNGQRGTRYEHRSRKLLERLGFVVERSAASQGAFDLVAWRPGCSEVPEDGWPQYLFVQVKSGRELRPSEWDAMIEEMREVAPPHGPADPARIIVHHWRKWAREPQVTILDLGVRGRQCG